MVQLVSHHADCDAKLERLLSAGIRSGSRSRGRNHTRRVREETRALCVADSAEVSGVVIGWNRREGSRGTPKIVLTTGDRVDGTYEIRSEKAVVACLGVDHTNLCCG